MKHFLPILLCLLTFWSNAQDRDCDPVVLKGNEINCMLGENPDMVVAFAYESGSWVQIPMQIDEMIVLDITAPYGPNDCPYKSYENVPWDVLFYCDPNSYIGEDVTDPNFDANDELAFMAKDVGAAAPQNSCPIGVVNTTKCELEVKDPTNNNTIGYVYVFRQIGGLDQAAGKDYVSHDFSYGTDYKRDYVHCVRKQPGVNPENTRIQTDNYEIQFHNRWREDVLKITAGNANGEDILDAHQMTITLGGCDHTEESFATNSGAIPTAIDGPVRAIRSTMGASSGPYIQMTYKFTECRVDYSFNFRLHPFKGFYDIFDLSNAASGMQYYNDQNQGGVTINGSQDNISTGNPNKWELITGNEGSIVVSYQHETDMSVGTMAQYDAGQRQGAVVAYYDDSGGGTSYKCTGDGRAIGSSGFHLRTLQCTDRRFTFDQYPECSPNFVKTFNHYRTHYILPPNQNTSTASKYGQFAKNPLIANVQALGSCMAAEPTCDDGIQNGDEEGVDCGGSNCPACPEPTCDDGIQNGDEEGVDCGGSDCPACPTCDDGIQNGDETGVDCGGSDCPACPTCDDGIQNGDETGVDCGGSNCSACPTCDDGIQNGDETGVDCGGSDCPICPPTCDDGIQNGDETGVDCGGSDCPVCPTCDDSIQNGDEEGIDCGGSNCPACPTCDDGIQNGDETDVDCGGSDCAACPTCDDGIQNGDEEGIDCGGSNCDACPEPTCDDGIQNGNETGVDCGGDCAPCPSSCEVPSNLYVTDNIGTQATLNWDAVASANSYMVRVRQQGSSRWRDRETTDNSLVASPLRSGRIYEWQVRSECDGESSDWSPLQTFEAGASEPTCDDGIQNGDETGVDCGGAGCPVCPTCDDGIQNGDERGVDCGGSDCLACPPACDDGIQNGDEEGVDCGGSNCPACPEPTCDDGIQNGNETGIDCGGDCAPCAEPSCDAPTNLSVSNIRRNKATLSWDAVVEAINYTVNVRAVGTSEWDDATTENTSIVARPLAPSTLYEWRVRSNCADETSEWSSFATFTTIARGERVRGRSMEIDEKDALKVSLYPNPARENLMLRVNRTIERIEIIDLAGRTMTVNWMENGSETLELSIAHLASGTYFVRIQSTEEVQTLRFVKR
ncbi:MAG: fibronectin type III domain-containing protein [Bacteroidota bacterium]